MKMRPPHGMHDDNTRPANRGARGVSIPAILGERGGDVVIALELRNLPSLG